MPVYQTATHTLKNSGIDTVFGRMGNGNMYIVTPLAQDCGIQYYAARHEGGALSMADAYARIIEELAARGFQQEGFHTEAVRREIAGCRPENLTMKVSRGGLLLVR